MNEKNRNVYNLQALGTTITYQVNWHFLLLVNIKTGCGNFYFELILQEVSSLRKTETSW